jgi:hypothetical protein
MKQVLIIIVIFITWSLSIIFTCIIMRSCGATWITRYFRQIISPQNPEITNETNDRIRQLHI